MSLQSNLKSVKESFDRDEKILESAFALEILWRRYRKFIIAFLICAVGAIVWWYVSGYMQEVRAKEASAAYAKLLVDSTDKNALETLEQKSPALYDVYRFFNTHNDMATYEELTHSSNAFVRSLAQYELASLRASELIDSQNGGIKDVKNTDALMQNITNLESTKLASLKNFALLQEAYLLFQADKVKEAHQKLMLIPENSLFWEEAVSLKHFGLELSKGSN